MSDRSAANSRFKRLLSKHKPLVFLLAFLATGSICAAVVVLFPLDKAGHHLPSSLYNPIRDIQGWFIDEIEPEPPSALHHLILRGDVQAWEVQALLDAGASLTGRWPEGGAYWHATPLEMAAARGASAEVLELLIGPGVPDADVALALRRLFEGCPGGHIGRKPTTFSQVKVLVDAGALEHEYFFSDPLDRAAYLDCSTQVLQLLVDSGGIGPTTGHQALHHVLKRDVADLAQVKMLVDAGSPLDATDYDGLTPLEIALQQRHPRDIVELLVPR